MPSFNIGSYDAKQVDNKTVYTVQYGDTLSQIARKYGKSVEDLAALNGIKDVNYILAGQELIIDYDSLVDNPPIEASSSKTENVIYRIKPGDTLTKISNMYGVSIQDIAKANNIQNIDLIYADVDLIIPNVSVEESAPVEVEEVAREEEVAPEPSPVQEVDVTVDLDELIEEPVEETLPEEVPVEDVPPVVAEELEREEDAVPEPSQIAQAAPMEVPEIEREEEEVAPEPSPVEQPASIAVDEVEREEEPVDAQTVQVEEEPPIVVEDVQAPEEVVEEQPVQVEETSPVEPVETVREEVSVPQAPVEPVATDTAIETFRSYIPDGMPKDLDVQLTAALLMEAGIEVPENVVAEALVAEANQISASVSAESAPETPVQPTEVTASEPVDFTYIGNYTGNVLAKRSASSSVRVDLGVITYDNQRYTVGGVTNPSQGTLSQTDYYYLVGQVAGESGVGDDDALGVCCTILNRVEAGGAWGNSVQEALQIGYWPWGKTCNQFINYDASGNPIGFKSPQQLGGEYVRLEKALRVVEDAMNGVRNINSDTKFYAGDGTHNSFSDSYN